MTDLTRTDDYCEKKTRSVAAATVDFSQVSDTALQELFNLPDKALITDAYVVVEVASQATVTVDLGFAGGAELANDAAVSSVAVVKDAGIKLPTGTGKNITAKFSAKPTAGRFVFIVEYIEFTLGNGKLMNYSEAV